jgi:hypothetical protein
MPIAAIPQGVEIRKITSVQKKALDELLGKERESNSLTTALLVGIPSIVAGSAVLAYVFKDEMKQWLQDQQDTLLDAAKKVVTGTGEGIVDIVLDAGNKIFRNDPVTPKMVAGSELSRCTRWAVDATDTLGRIQTGNLTKTQQTQAALNLIYIAKNMKIEGCSRPSAISQAQWDQA